MSLLSSMSWVCLYFCFVIFIWYLKFTNFHGGRVGYVFHVFERPHFLSKFMIPLCASKGASILLASGRQFCMHFFYNELKKSFIKIKNQKDVEECNQIVGLHVDIEIKIKIPSWAVMLVENFFDYIQGVFIILQVQSIQKAKWNDTKSIPIHGVELGPSRVGQMGEFSSPRNLYTARCWGILGTNIMYWISRKLYIILHKHIHIYKGICHWIMLRLRWSPPPLALSCIAHFQVGSYKSYKITLLPLPTNLVEVWQPY